MLKKLSAVSGLMIAGAAFFPTSAQSQIIPQPWVSLGVQDSDITYSVGARWLTFGAELGTGRDGATGVDVLQFLNAPIVSPYVGLGYYSGDNIAFSAGVQLQPTQNVFFGAGYHNIRGINGQIGVTF